MNEDEISQRSQAQFLTYTKPEKNVGKSNNEIVTELNQLDNILLDEEDKKVQIIVTEHLSEVSPDDFGYYTLYHTGHEEHANNNKIEIRESDKINKYKSKGSALKYYTPSNIAVALNETKNTNKGPVRLIPHQIDLILHFAKEENNRYGDLTLINPEDIKSEKEKLAMKTMSKKQTGAPTDEAPQEEEMVVNTYNSYILNEQMNFIIDEKFDAAVLKNKEYKEKKEKYEIELLYKLIQKMKDSKDTKKKFKLDNLKSYEDLSKNTENIRKEYEKLNETMKKNTKTYKLALFDLNSRAHVEISKFISSIIKNYNHSLEIDSVNFISWKKKISELVNIWDLFGCSGTELKFGYKYLIIKKFFSLRSQAKQANKELIKLEEDKNKLINLNPFDAINYFIKPKPDDYPVAVFSEIDGIRTMMDIAVGIFLLYSFFTIPLRLFLGADSSLFMLLEKFVDMYFYIDIMVTFRTAYRDKFNNDVYDIQMITDRYIHSYFIIDIISTVPWSFFFVSVEKLWRTIKAITHITKICRIIKLIPIFTTLEQLKSANYFRLVKLLLIYFLITHWMACILFYGVSYAINYNNLNPMCYVTNLRKDKWNLTNNCKYTISIYESSYIIPGQYTSYMLATNTLVPANEYITLIFEYLLGQVVSAYAFGGITSIIQNLDQGQNFFTEKTDLLREHMLFYDINTDVQNDVTVYYDYLWQRHKDVIYGKYHFDLLSKSLREKFEKFNLLGNEVYLARFHTLSNPKLIGQILMGLKKLILFPYEILFEEGELTKGLYILTNGDIELTNIKIKNVGGEKISVEFAEVMTMLEKNKILRTQKKQEIEFNVDNSKVFPLISAFIKTGRTYQRCYGLDFADILFLPLSVFDEIIASFPIEMHSLKHEIMHEVDKTKLFENQEVFNLLKNHSARSIGKYYEKEYTKLSIWIPIPIPISQRKIAKNYIESFVKKVRNQWREILLSSDLNICFNSTLIVNILKSDKINKKDKNEDEKNVPIQQSDQLDIMRNLSKVLNSMTDEFISYIEV